MNKKRVLFLCTGNSARSQMAEGIVNRELNYTWQAFSAGTKPSEIVHPLAIAAMAEIGIDLSDHHPKSTEEFRHSAFDLIITVCDHAAKMHVFRQVRDAIRKEILGFLTEWEESSSSQQSLDFVVETNLR